MTSPYVAAPARHSQTWRVALVVIACVLAPLAAAVAAFAAAIVWSGCFIECAAGSGDHLHGGLLWLLTAGLLLLGPAAAWLLLRTGPAVLAAAGGVLATLLTGALLLGVA